MRVNETVLCRQYNNHYKLNRKSGTTIWDQMGLVQLILSYGADVNVLKPDEKRFYSYMQNFLKSQLKRTLNEAAQGDPCARVTR